MIRDSRKADSESSINRSSPRPAIPLRVVRPVMGLSSPPSRSGPGCPGQLHVEAELHHVAVLHDVVLALHAGLPAGAGLGDASGVHEVVEGDDLGLDEALL